jgi:hypothetical protein
MTAAGCGQFLDFCAEAQSRVCGGVFRIGYTGERSPSCRERHADGRTGRESLPDTKMANIYEFRNSNDIENRVEKDNDF